MRTISIIIRVIDSIASYLVLFIELSMKH